MAASDEVRLTYTAEISDLRKKLASIPDITAAEARESVKKLDKAIKAVESQQTRALKSAQSAAKGADSYAKSTNTAALATRNLALQLPDVASQLAAGANPMTVLTQQGLQVGQSMIASGAALSGMLAILGPVAVAAAALGAVYLVLAHNLREAEEAQRRASEAATAAQQAFAGVSAVMQDLKTDVRLASGEIDELGLALEKRQASIGEAFGKSAKHLENTIAKLEQRNEALRKAAKEGKNDRGEIDRNTLAIARASEKLEALTERKERAIETAELLTDKTREERAAVEATRAARERAAAAADREREAKAKLAAQIEAINAAGAREVERMSDYVDQLRALKAASDALLAPDLSRLDQLMQLQDQLIEQAKTSTVANELLAESIGQVGTAIQDELGAEFDDAVKSFDEFFANARAQMVATWGGIGNDLSVILAASAEKIGETNSAMANKLNATAQVAGVAQLLISQAIALGKAWELGPLAGIAASLALGATFAKLINDVRSASVEFPTGGLVADRFLGSVDHVPVGVRMDEGILTGRGVAAAGGRDGVAALNRGASTMQAPIVVPVAIGRTGQRWFKDEARRAGAVRATVRQGARVGQTGW